MSAVSRAILAPAPRAAPVPEPAGHRAFPAGNVEPLRQRRPSEDSSAEMFEMSLPTGQQRVLESIEGKLAESDPRLVSLFSIFTRLTLTEKMPWIEQVAVRPIADRLAALAYWFRWMARRPAARVRAMVLLPSALTIAFGFPGSHQHVPGTKAPAARELVVKSRDLVARARLCRAMIRIPAFPAF